MDKESLIEFPCEFPIKIMGKNHAEFAQEVVAIVCRHCPDYDPEKVMLRPSRENHYLSVTCVVNAQSQEQLNRLYQELHDHPMVSVLL